MNHKHHLTHFTLVAGLLVGILGCDGDSVPPERGSEQPAASKPAPSQPAPSQPAPSQAAPSQPAPPPVKLTEEEKEERFAAVADLLAEAQTVKPPESVIELPAVQGWSQSDRRGLPPEDDGFSVGYNHESGLTVTLYQYNRGLAAIPDDVKAPPVVEELRRAADGIRQAVAMGIYQAADETAAKIVPLGDSAQQAQWSRYELTVRGEKAVSDTYVWARGGNFLKLRCTGPSENIAAYEAIVKPLLTAFGKASEKANQ